MSTDSRYIQLNYSSTSLPHSLSVLMLPGCLAVKDSNELFGLLPARHPESLRMSEM